MTTRIVGSDTYIQTWDAENRLVQVSKNGGVVATYVYDGDGNRVKATVGTVTTAYVGNYYEWKDNVATMVRYYYLGGQRIVMRQGSSTQYWLLTDHLGSTAITANVSGGKSSEVRYKAYGETRYTWGTMATDYRFTGQKLDSSVGLYLMGARWYDSSLSRWLSPDTIVPEPGNPQSLNRYSYVRNNPLVYVDPSGHHEATECDEDPASCLEDVDLNLVLDAWNDCIDCNKDMAWFWVTYIMYQEEMNSLNPDPEALANLQYLMGVYYQQAQAHTNEDLWDQVAPFAGEIGYFLGMFAVALGKDVSGALTGGAPIPFVPNPNGMKGNADHQLAVEELLDIATKEFGPDVEFRLSKSIKGGTGGRSNRMPDVSAWRNGKLIKVYEAARVDQTGEYVPREQRKMYEYYELDIPYYFLEVK